MNKRFFFIAIILTFFGIIIHGYGFDVKDNSIHISFIQKLADSNLYQDDYIFSFQTNPQLSISGYYVLFAFLTKNLSVSLETLFFLAYTVAHTLFLFAVYLLTMTFFQNKRMAFMSMLLFLVPLHIGGTAIFTTETVLIPRFIGNTLALFIFFYSLKKELKRVLFILPFQFFVHPPSVLLSATIVFAVSVSAQKKYFLKVLTFSSLTILLLLLLRMMNASFLQKPSFEYLHILHFRNPYAFPDLWTFKGWFLLLILLSPFFIYEVGFRKSENKHQEAVRAIVLLSIFVFMVHVMFTSLFPTTNIINLQLGRIWYIPVVISLIYVGYFAANITFSVFKKPFLFYSFSFVILTALFFFKLSQFPQKQFSDWINTQLWVHENTAKECMFLVPFYSEGFRIHSQRPIVGEYKDGALSFYSEEFAYEWYSRFQHFKNWEALSEDELLKLQEKYDFSFLVTHENTNLKKVYENGTVKIYQLPQLQKNCQLL